MHLYKASTLSTLHPSIRFLILCDQSGAVDSRLRSNS